MRPRVSKEKSGNECSKVQGCSILIIKCWGSCGGLVDAVFRSIPWTDFNHCMLGAVLAILVPKSIQFRTKHCLDADTLILLGVGMNLVFGHCSWYFADLPPNFPGIGRNPLACIAHPTYTSQAISARICWLKRMEKTRKSLGFCTVHVVCGWRNWGSVIGRNSCEHTTDEADACEPSALPGRGAAVFAGLGLSMNRTAAR